MIRPSLPQLLLAFIAGGFLLLLTIFFSGVLAASSAQRLLAPLLQNHSWAELILRSILLVHIPMTLISGIFALLVFRLLRARGMLVVLALSAPWLIYCLVAALSWYQGTQISPLHILMMELTWHKWIGRLSVPLGVWVASKLAVSRVRDAA